MTEIKPSELTAEERAIVDRFAAHQAEHTYTTGWDADYSRAIVLAQPCILARRAIFGSPASEEKCVLHEEIVRDGPSKWSCETHPEPAATEMPARRYTAEQVREWIHARGYLSTDQYNDFGRLLPTVNMGACMEALAEALEEIEALRSQPVTPPPVMSEELEYVLMIAKQYAPSYVWDKSDAAIAAVRAQATASKVR